jgi:uncharacterized protein YdaU (DUF1376 family)
MSRLPYYKFNPDDYRNATDGLDWVEDSVYRNLIDLAWKSKDGSIPADLRELKRKLRWWSGRPLHGRRFNRIVPMLLARFFDLGPSGPDQRYYQKRVVFELVSAGLDAKKLSEISLNRWARHNEIKRLEHEAASSSRSYIDTDKDLSSSSRLSQPNGNGTSPHQPVAGSRSVNGSTGSGLPVSQPDQDALIESLRRMQATTPRGK